MILYVSPNCWKVESSVNYVFHHPKCLHFQMQTSTYRSISRKNEKGIWSRLSMEFSKLGKTIIVIITRLINVTIAFYIATLFICIGPHEINRTTWTSPMFFWDGL